jgi:hypothetical protein
VRRLQNSCALAWLGDPYCYCASCVYSNRELLLIPCVSFIDPYQHFCPIIGTGIRFFVMFINNVNFVNQSC